MDTEATEIRQESTENSDRTSAICPRSSAALPHFTLVRLGGGTTVARPCETGPRAHARKLRRQPCSPRARGSAGRPDLRRLPTMHDETELSEHAALRRGFLLRDAAKILSLFLGTAAFGCFFSSHAVPWVRTLSLVVGVICLVLGVWAFCGAARCPKCGRRMAVRRLPGNSAPLHLVCSACGASIDLKTLDSNP